MTNFRATTETGTVWERKDGILHITPVGGWGYVFKPWQQVVVDRSIPEQISDAYLRDAPFADVPVVGKGFFAAGKREWRLSTNMVSVEILGSEHDE